MEELYYSEGGRMTFWNAQRIISISNQRFSAGSSLFSTCCLFTAYHLLRPINVMNSSTSLLSLSNAREWQQVLLWGPFFSPSQSSLHFHSLISLNFLLLPNAFAVHRPLVVTLMTLLWKCWAAPSLTQPLGKLGVFWELPTLKSQPLHWWWNQVRVSRSLWI